MSKRYFITGIGTDVGKTIISAIVTEALEADYWKPVQAGGVDCPDSEIVRSLVSNSQTRIHPEVYFLKNPMSPHAAAELDGVKIDLQNIQIPVTENTLVIEGAGGFLVPLNEKELVADLITRINCDVILVSRNYLGSINHTLLTIEALKSRKIPVSGIIFNGNTVPSTEKFILDHTGLECLGRIPEIKEFSKEVVKEQAGKLKNNLKANDPF